jgi:hypothetical protein
MDRFALFKILEERVEVHAERLFLALLIFGINHSE